MIASVKVLEKLHSVARKYRDSLEREYSGKVAVYIVRKLAGIQRIGYRKSVEQARFPLSFMYGSRR